MESNTGRDAYGKFLLLNLLAMMNIGFETALFQNFPAVHHVDINLR
jgi:hypothetical protein